jgi:hypothetical protein
MKAGPTYVSGVICIYDIRHFPVGILLLQVIPINIEKVCSPKNIVFPDKKKKNKFSQGNTQREHAASQSPLLAYSLG